MTFRAWLREREHEESPVGDLARDVDGDRRLPRGPLSPDRLRRHMRYHAAACPEALDALDEAERRWRAA